jgi:hypothetical protein
MKGWVKTGRVDSRRACLSCQARIRLGEPHPTSNWAERLRLTKEQTDLLLVAAAEFSELSEEAGEYALAVTYVDWVAGVLRQSGIRFEADGAPPRNESGTAADVRQMRHRHPDPIPFAPLPRTWR